MFELILSECQQDPHPVGKMLICWIRIRPKMDRIGNPALCRAFRCQPVEPLPGEGALHTELRVLVGGPLLVQGPRGQVLISRIMSSLDNNIPYITMSYQWAIEKCLSRGNDSEKISRVTVSLQQCFGSVYVFLGSVYVFHGSGFYSNTDPIRIQVKNTFFKGLI